MTLHRRPALPRLRARCLARALAAAVLACGLAAPAVASAQSAKDVAAARQAFREGEEAEAGGDMLIALEKFKDAASRKETAQLDLRIGEVEEKLGRLVDAIASYERGRAKASKLPAVAKVADEQIRSLRARVPRLTVVVPSPPQDLVVTIDGAPFSASAYGTPVPVDPGTHRLHAEAPGFSPRDQAFTIAEKSTQRVEVSLMPSADAVAAAPPPPPSKVPDAILLAGGGAALVAGATMLAMSYVKDGTVNSLCGGSARTGCPQSMASEITSEIGTINNLRVGSIPVSLAGAACVVAGAVLLSRSPAPATVAPAVGPGSAGMTVTGRF